MTDLRGGNADVKKCAPKKKSDGDERVRTQEMPTRAEHHVIGHISPAVIALELHREPLWFNILACTIRHS